MLVKLSDHISGWYLQEEEKIQEELVKLPKEKLIDIFIENNNAMRYLYNFFSDVKGDCSSIDWFGIQDLMNVMESHIYAFHKDKEGC